MRRQPILLGLLTLLATAASATDRWVHVRVDESGADGESVRIDVPMGFVRAMLTNVESEGWNGEGLSLGRDVSWNDVDLRAVLRALNEAPAGEFLKIRSHDESVRVAKDAGFLLVHVDEKDGEQVRVRMPLEVLDALLGSGEDRLDFAAALEALADHGGGDLVTVDSSDSRVRIWIDARPEGD